MNLNLPAAFYSTDRTYRIITATGFHFFWELFIVKCSVSCWDSSQIFINLKWIYPRQYLVYISFYHFFVILFFF